MKLLQILGLTLVVLVASQEAIAQSASSQGHAQVDINDEEAKLTIRGPAAEALYQTLSKKENAEISECESGTTVVLSPFACHHRKDGTTFCATKIGADETSFSPTDNCLQPKLSIIGVGSIRTVEDSGVGGILIPGAKPMIPGIAVPGSNPGILIPGGNPGIIKPCLPLSK